MVSLDCALAVPVTPVVAVPNLLLLLEPKVFHESPMLSGRAGKALGAD